MRWCRWFIALFVSAGVLHAQDNGHPSTRRADQIQSQRLNKAANLTPAQQDPTEKKIDAVMDRIPKFLKWGPVRLNTGGLYDGAGFALGTQLLWKSPADQTRFAVSAVGSTREFYILSTGITVLPEWAHRQLRIGLEAAHSDAPRLEYYGSGPDSSKGDRTDYRREDTTLMLGVAWTPPRRHVSARFESGPLFVNVGPGTDSRFASTETVFTSQQAPGVNAQTDFFRTSTVLSFDNRDRPGDPRSGSRILLGHQNYADIDLKQYSFDRVLVGAEHYVPFLNKKRVVALRADTELSYHSENQLVPFYLQPALGGSNSLRGFRWRRFTGENALLLSAEYRWEISTGFDMAFFGDAGRVFDRPQSITLRHLETSPGFGLRFKTAENVVMRIDTGFSHEGFQIWLRFNAGL